MFDISIIIPVYNAEKYIERCLNSITSQTYSEPVECILVDDGSSDNSLSVIHRCIDGYDGQIYFVVISHETNSGQAAARNTGIKASHGKYLLFIDIDDYIAPDCLEVLCSAALNYPEVNVCFANSINAFTGLSEISKAIPQFLDNNDIIMKLYLSKIIPVQPWNKLIKRDFLIQNELYFKEGIFFEDTLWNYHVCKFLSSCIYVPTVTYYYENNANSTMNSLQRKLEKAIRSLIVIVDDILNNMVHGHEVGTCVFVQEILFFANDTIKNEKLLSEGVKNDFSCLKKDFTRYVSRSSLLHLYSLLLYVPPMCNPMKNSFFRKHQYLLLPALRKYAKWKVKGKPEWGKIRSH